MEALGEQAKYEVKRGQPLPSKSHSIIQSNLLVALVTSYGEQYRFLSEITLETPRFVPDIGLFPPINFDPLHDQIKLNQVPVGVIKIRVVANAGGTGRKSRSIFCGWCSVVLTDKPYFQHRVYHARPGCVPKHH